MEELQQAVSSLANNKCPGIDGLPNEIHGKFGEILLPQLLQVFQDSSLRHQLSDSMQEDYNFIT